MIFKDEDGDLWRVNAEGKIEVRLTLQGTGVDDEGAPADEGWGEVLFLDDRHLLTCVDTVTADILQQLRNEPDDRDGDEYLSLRAAQLRIQAYQEDMVGLD